MRRMGPSGLDIGFDGGVNDAARAWLGAREKDEFRLVEDALGLDERHFGPFPDPIHRSAAGIKMIRIIFCGAIAVERQRPFDKSRNSAGSRRMTGLRVTT